MVERSINDVAASLRSVRLFLEPVTMTMASGNMPHRADDPSPSLGVHPYLDFPERVDAGPAWYRVLGREGALNCKSSVFIFASLPNLIPSPVCTLDNAGYLDFPEDAHISFVEFTWGSDVISQAVPAGFPHGHSTLSIDNHTLVDLWLVWSGDASSTDFVPNGHASKHGGGSIFSANFLITVYRNANGQIGEKIGNAAITVHGADAGELVVWGNFLFLVTATDAIKIGLLVVGTGVRPRGGIASGGGDN